MHCSIHQISLSVCQISLSYLPLHELFIVGINLFKFAQSIRFEIVKQRPSAADPEGRANGFRAHFFLDIFGIRCVMENLGLLRTINLRLSTRIFSVF